MVRRVVHGKAVRRLSRMCLGRCSCVRCLGAVWASMCLAVAVVHGAVVGLRHDVVCLQLERHLCGRVHPVGRTGSAERVRSGVMVTCVKAGVVRLELRARPLCWITLTPPAVATAIVGTFKPVTGSMGASGRTVAATALTVELGKAPKDASTVV